MKILSLLLSICVAASCVASIGAANAASDISSPAFSKYYTAFQTFKTNYNKKYKSIEEEARRLHIFITNQQYIDLHNTLHAVGQVAYTLQANAFADLTTAEFSVLMKGHNPSVGSATRRQLNFLGTFTATAAQKAATPSSLDWSSNGAVTPIKNQGSCGSCWTFSSTGAIEGAQYIKHKNLVSLSEQQLLDCVGTYTCSSGGAVSSAFDYLSNNQIGSITESTKSYAGSKGSCSTAESGAKNTGVQVTGWYNIPANDEDTLRVAVNQQPISIAIDASATTFQFYSIGVYDTGLYTWIGAHCCSNCSPSQLDHAVLLVGYGSSSGKDYWLVKNSWGSWWGLYGGYFRLPRNMNGLCGAAASALFPVVS